MTSSTPTSRRAFLRTGVALPFLGTSALLTMSHNAQAADYKAIVVLYLSGGHDGNNMLIPVDGAYADYQRARPALALPKDNLARIGGKHIGHDFALSPACRPLVDLFERQRLAIVANVGALVQPTTIDEVKNRTAHLPPFLGSHAEQEQWTQGWMGDVDPSGWGGRAIDLLPAEMRNYQPLIAIARDYTAVTAPVTPLSLASSNSSTYWGRANINDPNDQVHQRLEWLSRMQSTNVYEQEFARSLRTSYLDAIEFGRGQAFGAEPAGNYPDSELGRGLRFLARHIPFSKQVGARRQVYLVQEGRYDTHAGQMSTDPQNPGMEMLLGSVAQSLVAFDQSMAGVGMGDEVLVLVLSEFGRTLDPAAGQGSDHAWGNHWFVMGNYVKGGKIYGDKFPSLVVGGADDASIWQPARGQWLPQYSSDQFMADAFRWFGLSAQQCVTAMPNLGNFPSQKIGYL